MKILNSYPPDVEKVNFEQDKCLSKCEGPSAHNQATPRQCSWGQHPPASQWVVTPPNNELFTYIFVLKRFVWTTTRARYHHLEEKFLVYFRYFLEKIISQTPPILGMSGMNRPPPKSLFYIFIFHATYYYLSSNDLVLCLSFVNEIDPIPLSQKVEHCFVWLVQLLYYFYQN